jgi:hypothetical protein
MVVKTFFIDLYSSDCLLEANLKCLLEPFGSNIIFEQVTANNVENLRLRKPIAKG